MIIDMRIPTEKELQKEIQEFQENLQKKYGPGVGFRIVTERGQQGTPGPSEEDTPEPQKTFDLKFDLKPKDIKKYLDRYVIKQDDAKKALAIAVCDHYNHVRECHENPEAADTDYSKQNIVMLGPTGYR